MIVQNVAKKNFRLKNGNFGTEYEAVAEVIAFEKARLQRLEDRIEELQRQLELAEGHP